MKKIEITEEDLKKLVNTAIQFGVDSPELVPNQKGREKIANWMVDNTIKDIEKNITQEGEDDLLKLYGR